MTHMQTMTTDEQFQALAADPILCPNCGHGIDPHGADPGGICGVGSVTEQGDIDHCLCLLSPNAIAHLLLATDPTEAEMDAASKAYWQAFRLGLDDGSEDSEIEREALRAAPHVATGECPRDPVAETRELLAAATPGPWVIIGGGEYITPVGIMVAPDDGGVRDVDADLIAAAPRLLAALADEVERMRAERFPA